MLFHEVPSKNFDYQKSTEVFGFDIANVKIEKEKAFNLANEVCLKSGTSFIEMRIWSESAKMSMGKLILEANRGNSNALTELKNWEEKVLNRIHWFVDQFSSYSQALDRLNPPLTTENIRPFQAIVSMNRKSGLETIQALVPIIREYHNIVDIADEE
ncbi:MAG: hypothetical protein ACKVQC_09870 [Elusimicrobiota bacterium]